MGISGAEFDKWRFALEALARTGLAFSPAPYDRERFEEVLRIALEMSDGVASFAHAPAVVDLREVHPDVFNSSAYVTPKVGVTVVVADDYGRLLLTKRPTGEWFLPGGFADVGYSPAEVAVKEVREELGLDVEVVRLLGVMDGLRSDRRVPQYSLMFLAREVGGTLTNHPHEVLDSGWFHPADVPQPLLDDGRTWLQIAGDAVNGLVNDPYFDQVDTSTLLN